MNQQVLIVSLVGGFLGLLSAILGFSAEATKITYSDIDVSLYGCVYPSSPAFGLAIGAALFLLVAQIIVTAFGGCCGCCKRNPTVPVVTGNKQTLGIILAVISWINFAIALILYIVGAARNGSGGQTATLYDCYVAKSGVFASGAICGLIAIFLSIVSYIIFNPLTDDTSRLSSGIPVIPPLCPQPQPLYPASGVKETEFMPPGQGGLPADSTSKFSNRIPVVPSQFPPLNSQYTASGVSEAQYPPPGTGGTHYTTTTNFST